MPAQDTTKMTLDEFHAGRGSHRAGVEHIELPSGPKHHFDPGHFDESLLQGGPPFKLYIGRLPYDLTRHDLEAFFREAGVNASSTRLVMDTGSGLNKGYGYVVLETAEVCCWPPPQPRARP